MEGADRKICSARHFFTEGMMFRDRILDPERAKKFENVPKTIQRRGGVMPEWYDACRGGSRPVPISSTRSL